VALHVTDELIDRYLAYRRALGPAPWSREEMDRAHAAAGIAPEELVDLVDLVAAVVKACAPYPVTSEEEREVREKTFVEPEGVQFLRGMIGLIAGTKAAEKFHSFVTVQRARRLASELHGRHATDQLGDKELALNAAAERYGTENVTAVLARLEDLRSL
jgi:hypothetical protein